jgi:hypothetical protein
MSTPNLALPAPAPARRPLIAFPLVLIGLGIVFLLANAGYVGEGALRRLVDLWPIALVLIGGSTSSSATARPRSPLS